MRWQQAHPNATVPRSRLNPFLFDFAILEHNSGFRNWVLWANNILCYNLAPITLALLLFRYADRQDFQVTLWHYATFVVDSYLVWRLLKALSNNEEPDISEHNRSLPAGSAGILPAERVSNMTTKEGDANPALIQTERQEYFDRINQAQQYLIYKPNTIANSALSAICNPKYEIKDKLPKETRLTSAQVFRNSYIHIDKKFNQNPDYPKILLDIDYQLCTLDECKDLRDGIEGLDCQKASQNPPKW